MFSLNNFLGMFLNISISGDSWCWYCWSANICGRVKYNRKMMFYGILDLILMYLRFKESTSWNFSACKKDGLSMCNWGGLLFLIATQELIQLLTLRKSARNRKTEGEMGGRSNAILFL